MTRSTLAFATAARAAGAVVALGYLTGLVAGAVIGLIGALAAITFGRALLRDRSDHIRSSVALALIGLALAVGALRWGAYELESLRGIQAVFGPTIVTGSPYEIAATGAAAAAAVAAAGVWLGSWTRPRAWWAGDAGLVAVAVVTIYAGPSLGGGTDLVWIWAAAIAAAASGATLLSMVTRGRAAWFVLLGSALSLAAATAVLVIGAT